MRKEYPLHELRRIESRMYDILLLVGKDEFEKMIKEYLQDEINKIGIQGKIMNQNELHEEHMKQAQLGWNEIQIKCIKETINLHIECLKEEQEKDNVNQN
jgi:hypothetical protein